MAISRRQYTAICKVLMQPSACQMAGKYVARNGDTCAIGALALEAGIPKSWFWRSERNGAPVYTHDLSRVTSALSERYGLSLEAAMSLQRANDSVRPYKDVDAETLHKKRLGKVLKALRDAYRTGL